MRCALILSAVLLLTTALAGREAHANPALLAAKAAQAASRAAQAARAAGAASKAGRLTKLGRIGSRAMRRAMGNRMGGGVMKPNALRMRMKKAMKLRKGFQRVAAERQKRSFRHLMRQRMNASRVGVKNVARKQINRRLTQINRTMRDRNKFSMRRIQQLQRRNRAQSNQQDQQRRRSMRSHAAEMRRQSGVFATAMSRHVGSAAH
ncbi:MAG TPA: hypothetical protein VFU21_27115 [Kofleriaceae bacterium]|nr:hypothetical protein [Kofleriaceae bacterium]